MAEKSKKSFFETRLMRSRIKGRTVSLFPEAAFGYLLGPILALVGNGVINIWLVQYWQRVLGFESWAPLYGVLLPLISSIVIIAGNIFIGRLMERKPTLAGKARPFILLGMPLILVSMLILFIVPFPPAGVEGATTMDGGILTSIMAAVGYNLYYAFAWPMYYTPHSALVNLSTRDSAKRGLLGTAIMAAQLGAAGVSGMAGGVLVDLLGLLPKYEYTAAYIAAHKEKLGDVTSTSSYASLVKGGLVEGVDYNTVIDRAAANQKWLILMLVMIGALIVGCILEYFFTRERITEEQIQNAEAKAEVSEPTKKVTMAQQIKICVKDKTWWLLMIFWFLYQFGGQMKNIGMSFFSDALVGGASVSSLINTVGAIPTALGMVIVWPLAKALTKSKTIALGGVVAGLAGLAAYACLIPGINGNAGAIMGVSVASFCIKALGTAPAMYISVALMANVLDHQEAVHGVRTDGFTMAVYGSIMVAMSGICNGVIAGFTSLFPGNDMAAQFVTTTLAFGVEAVCYIAIAAMFLFMNVEKFTNVDNKAIVADQKAEILAAGGRWVEPEVRAKQEEEENARLVEEARVAQLRENCEKKGLNFEEENAKFLAQKAEADKKAADKKAEAEAKKQAKLDAMTADEKLAMEARARVRKQRQEAKDAAAMAELNAIRQRVGRDPVPVE